MFSCKMSDKEAQEDEVLALASIYEVNVFSANEDGGFFTGEFKAFPQLPQGFFVVKDSHDEERKVYQVDYLPPITLHFELPPDYPSNHPPNFTLSCKWLSKKQLSELCEKLDKIWLDNKGEVVLFHWINFLNEESLCTLSIKESLNLSDVVLKGKRKRQISAGKIEENLRSKTKDENSVLIINDQNNSDFERSQVSNVERTSSVGFTEPIPSSVNARKEEKVKNKTCHWKASNSRDVFHKTNTLSHSKLPKTNLKNSKSANFAKDKKQTSDIQQEESKRAEINPRENCKYDDRTVQETFSETELLAVILEYNKLRKQQIFDLSFFTCKVCFEEKLGSRCKAFKPCNHVFCKCCLKTYFEVQISSGSVTRLDCPEEGCSSQATPPMVRELVEPELYMKYDRLLLATTLDTMSDIMYCPRRSCHCPVLVEPESNMATCPSCYLVFCVYCKMTYHGVVPCRLRPDEQKKLVEDYVNGDSDEKKLIEQRYGRQQVQQLVDNVLSEDWINLNSKACPNCNAHIEKLDGCNKMTCWRCDSYFCWLCMARLTKGNPYLHYNDLKSPCNGRLFLGVNDNEDHDDEDDDDDDDHENEWELGQFL